MRPIWRNVLAVVAVVALVAAGCGKSKKSSTAASTGNQKTGGTFVYGASSDPVSMDGAYVSDGESLRVIDQVFETLVTLKPGGYDIVPKLAKSWDASSDGTTWTFHLQSGVKFHDGSAFDAKAVCFNFDRWYHFKGVQQNPSVSYYWSTVFGGFATHDDPSVAATSLYKSCAASDASTAVITLTSPSSSFLSALVIPAFSIASPDALTKYEADKVSGTGDSPKFEGTFGTQHPIGTGPFKLESYTPNDRLVLTRNPDYWGPKPFLDKAIFRPIVDGAARRQALESGDIQGYDNVAPDDISGLQATAQILRRPAFNVGYVGFNQAKPPLDNVKIRQAIAYALNRQALVTAKYSAGSKVAKEFMPPDLFGYASDVTQYNYDVNKAKQLIKDSGVANPTLEFWYPTNVSRPYMPDPSANLQAFKADLEAAGFKVNVQSAPWKPDYQQKVNAGSAQMYLLGWTGDFGDPDNFLGTFFGAKQPAWGFDNTAIFDKLAEARKEPDKNKRIGLYKEANKLIMDFLPGVPYVHTSPGVALAKNVKGYHASPVGLDVFALVSLG